jgi:hypothetical protein
MMSKNGINFIETSIHWSTYRPCLKETPPEHRAGRCNTVTLDAESFIYLWQTSIDAKDFQARIYNLRKSNPRFYDGNWQARARRYRKKGIELKELRKETNNEKLNKFAKKFLTII